MGPRMRVGMWKRVVQEREKKLLSIVQERQKKRLSIYATLD
jgi:hypothetical protein